MTEVVLLAPFLLDCDLDVAVLLRRGAADVAKRLADALPAGWQPEPAPAPRSAALLDGHTSQGALRLPRALLRARRAPLDRAGLPARVHLDDVTLTVSPLGVASVQVRATLARDTQLDDVECWLLDRLRDDVRGLASALAGALPTDCRAMQTQNRLPPAKLLWFHRLLTKGVSPLFDRETAYGVRVELAGGGVAVLADGYSRVSGGDRDEAAAAVRALVLSTERWIALDAENRRLADGLVRLRALRAHDRVRAYQESLRLSEVASLTTLVLAEHWRYVANAEYVLSRALSEAWHVADEERDLAQHVAVLRDLADRHLAEQRGRLDRTRTALAYAFTGMSTLIALLVVYDFVTGPGVARRVVGAVVGVVSAAWLVAVFVRQRRDG